MRRYRVTGKRWNQRVLCNKTAKQLTQSLWNDSFIVLLDGVEYPFEKWSDSQYTYVYLHYLHSEHEIKIIPEPFYIITLAVLAGSSILILYKSKRKEIAKTADESLLRR